MKAIKWVLVLILIASQQLGFSQGATRDAVGELVIKVKGLRTAEATALAQKFETAWADGSWTGSERDEISVASAVLLDYNFSSETGKSMLAVLFAIKEGNVLPSSEKSVALKTVRWMLENRSQPEIIAYYNKMADFATSGVFLKGNGYQASISGGSMQLLYPDNAMDSEEYYAPDPSIALKGTSIQITKGAEKSTLENTKFFFTFGNDFAYGEAGNYIWPSSKSNGQNISVALQNYDFNFSMLELSGESAVMTHPAVDKPIEGTFRYVVKGPVDTSSPAFRSYNNDLPIDYGMGSEIKFTSGFSLVGSKQSNAGLYSAKTEMEYYRGSELAFKVASPFFNIDKVNGRVSSDPASVTIFHGADSIYHPGAIVRFDAKTKDLSLEISEVGAYRYANYHLSMFEMELMAQTMNWTLDGDTLGFSVLRGKSEIPTMAISKNYFNRKEYLQQSYMLDFHPIGLLASYAEEKGVREFFIGDLAFEKGKNENTLVTICASLDAEGFISFDRSSRYVIIKDKLIHAFESSTRKTDYDNILIPSVSDEKYSAYVLLSDNTLNLVGVDKFYVSDSIDMVITPEDKLVTIHPNRRIGFDGGIESGKFAFKGKKFMMDYDTFAINLEQIDKIQLKIENENKEKVEIDNELTETSGILYINEPNNKSFLKPKPEYPKFASLDTAKVFFDSEKTLDGVYGREVFFDVPPFEIDSTVTSDPAKISFQGKFVSGKIFPEFEEKLKIRPDNSLGFSHETPAEGYAVYESKSTFSGAISMDKSGIKGYGELKHMNATLELEDGTFFPDSLIAKGKGGSMIAGSYEGISTPQMDLPAHRLKWFPGLDSMRLGTISEPFAFYQKQGNLKGELYLTKNGVKGQGDFDILNTLTKSTDFTFKETEMIARGADFTVNSNTGGRALLKGDSVKLNFNFAENYADLQSEDAGKASLEFPYAYYKTSIPNARWDLNAEKIIMKKPESTPLEDSYFYSTRESMDSLSFNGTDAVYDIAKQELEISGVPYILVADGKIFPAENKLTVLENSKIRQLTNARVVLDAENEYHTITNASIDIISKNRMEGEGFYQFISLGDTFNIKFSKFQWIEPAGEKPYTQATGVVLERENLGLYPGFKYKGDLIMKANKPGLELEGYIKVDLKKQGKLEWIAYKASAEQAEISLDFDKAKSEDGSPLTAGLYYSNYALYSTFLAATKRMDDELFFRPSGNLTFEEEKGEYRIETPAKAKGEQYNGQMYAYNETTGEVKFEGKMNFSNDKRLAMVASGIGVGNADSSTFEIDAFVGFKWPVNPEMISGMASELAKLVPRLGLEKADGDLTSYLYKASEFTGHANAKAYEEAIATKDTSLVGYSPELAAMPLVLSGVDLKWSRERKAFYNEGKIGISNVLGTSINAKVPGFMELRKSDEGDFFTLLLHVTAGEWYYFTYDGIRLSIASSNKVFYDLVKTKNNALSAKIGEFTYLPADLEEAQRFVDNFRKTYFGIVEKYNLDVPAQEKAPVEKKDGF